MFGQGVRPDGGRHLSRIQWQNLGRFLKCGRTMVRDGENDRRVRVVEGTFRISQPTYT